MKAIPIVVIIIGLVLIVAGLFLPEINPMIGPTRTPEPTPKPTISHDPQPEETRTPEKFLVWQYAVNIHSAPEIDSPIVGWVNSGQSVDVLVCRSGWAYIYTQPELYGWINGTCLNPNPCGPAGSCDEIK